jgi:predicted dehydrogenase
MQPVKLGIIGTGQRCIYFFVPYIKSSPEKVKLIGIADNNPERLNSANQDIGMPIKSYSNYEDLLENPDIEAVIIATPDSTHKIIFEKALARGKDILCEKPLATTLEDAIHMVKISLKAKNILQLGFMLRYSPFYSKLKEIIDKGSIGRIQNIKIHETVESYHGATYFRRWHRFVEKSGGLLIHKACHTLDIANWLIEDKPSWVSATGGIASFLPKQGTAMHCKDCQFKYDCSASYRFGGWNWNYLNQSERENLANDHNDLCVYQTTKDSVDNAVVKVQYSNQINMEYNFSATGSYQERHFTIKGSSGIIIASQHEGNILISQTNLPDQLIKANISQSNEHGDGDNPLMDDFINSIRSRKAPIADILSGCLSVAIGDAATKSINNNSKWINIDSELSILPNKIISIVE